MLWDGGMAFPAFCLVLLVQLLACWVSQPWLGWCLWVPGTASRAPGGSSTSQRGQNRDGSLDLPQGSAIPTASNCPELPGDTGWEQQAGMMSLGTLAHKGLLHFKECH